MSNSKKHHYNIKGKEVKRLLAEKEERLLHVSKG